jgi:hypothetical protein
LASGSFTDHGLYVQLGIKFDEDLFGFPRMTAGGNDPRE